MKIIELNEKQFKNYANLHSSRNYFQTVEYANIKNKYKKNFLGFINENDNTIMGAVLLLEKKVWKFKIGIVPGGFLVDYNNDQMFKDFVITLKNYLKTKKFIFLETNNLTTYKMFDKDGNVIYFDTNIIKLLDELSFKKSNKNITRRVVLETEKTPNETYELFDDITKENIDELSKKGITVYKDENNNLETLSNLTIDGSKNLLEDYINNFTKEDNKAEIYFAKIDLEKYINNYRFFLKEEEENNDELNNIMQDISIAKDDSFIDKKMNSDRLITKYNKEITRASNLYAKYPDGLVIGAILIIKNNREIYFLNEAHNKETPDILHSYLIKWEIIKKYLTEGYKIFNFGNIKNMDSSNLDYKFKMGFGGKVYECIGDYDLVINKFLYKFVKLLNKFIK